MPKGNKGYAGKISGKNASMSPHPRPAKQGGNMDAVDYDKASKMANPSSKPAQQKMGAGKYG